MNQQHYTQNSICPQGIFLFGKKIWGLKVYVYELLILAEYPPYGRDIQLVPAEGYSGAFGPFMTLGFQPNVLVKMK